MNLKVRSHGAAATAIFCRNKLKVFTQCSCGNLYFYMMPLLLLHRIGSEPILWQPLPQPHSVNDSICYNVIQLLRQKKAQPLPHQVNGPLQFVFFQCFVQIVGPLNFRSMFNLNKVYIALNLTFKNEEIRNVFCLYKTVI